MNRLIRPSELDRRLAVLEATLQRIKLYVQRERKAADNVEVAALCAAIDEAIDVDE